VTGGSLISYLAVNTSLMSASNRGNDVHTDLMLVLLEISLLKSLLDGLIVLIASLSMFDRIPL
jgi:hypothetical protein